MIADQLGLLLQRRVRRNLHAAVVQDVHPAVDLGAYPILSGVARYGGGVTAAALGTEIGVDRALVSRRAAELVDAGLLAAHGDPQDRRRSLLTLTEEGEQVVERLRGRLVSAIDHRLSGWPASDRKQLARLLTDFVSALGDDADS